MRRSSRDLARNRILRHIAGMSNCNPILCCNPILNNCNPILNNCNPILNNWEDDVLVFFLVATIEEPPDGSPFSAIWEEFAQSEERERWFKGEGYEAMHVQGRRWGGMAFKDSVYEAGPTFESYGVDHRSSDLIRAVADAHKKFLTESVWVHEES